MNPAPYSIPNWIKKPVKRLIWGYRYATSPWRALPDMLIIGAQKAGTSSLHAWLSEHPQILPPFEKEVHFFDDGNQPAQNNFEKGLPWYKAHFPLALADQNITFETSPLYLFHPLAAQRIKATLPKARLLIVLRNPVDRAISHYFHSVKNTVEPLPLEEALEKEESRLMQESRSGEYSGLSLVRHSYKARGRYAEQIKRYLDHFSREQLLIVESEQLFADPVACLSDIFEFAGVDSDFSPTKLVARNVSTNRDEVSDATYTSLSTYFEPHNQELYQLIGKQFNW